MAAQNRSKSNESVSSPHNFRYKLQHFMEVLPQHQLVKVGSVHFFAVVVVAPLCMTELKRKHIKEQKKENACTMSFRCLEAKFIRAVA